jgi:hypothetical protein
MWRAYGRPRKPDPDPAGDGNRTRMTSLEGIGSGGFELP